MLANMIRMGTKYGCNLDNEGDLIYLQSQIINRPYMIAISFNRDQICLQSLAFTRFVQKSFSRDSRTISDIASNWSLLKWIASIHSSFRI